MTDTTQGAVQTDAMDTAAVLAHASGDKTYVSEPKAEPKAEAEDGQEEDPGEDTAAPETDEPPAEKPKLSAKDRVQQAVARQRESERERDYWRDVALKAQQPAQPTPTAQPEGDGKPDPEKFEGGVYDPAYVEALTDWKAEQAVSRLLSQREGQAQFKTALSTFEQKVKDAYPDGEPAGITALRRAPNLPQTVFDLITASDNGPKLADHLGNNPSEYQRLIGLAPHLQGVEFARLEQRLATPPAPIPKTATDAPEPAPTVRGAGGRFTVAADTNDFSAFEKQYAGG